jgi:gamma-glutamyl-gamma-aminobutyrate hydrolase PuuD
MPKLTKYGNAPSARVIVSFRQEQGRAMHASFYDHYTLRKITGRDTLNAISPAMNAEQIAESVDKFAMYINDSENPHTLGLDDEPSARVVPALTYDTAKDGGLIIIPGHRRFPKPGEYYDERAQYEYKLINDARMRGQPILAICGGSWKLWQSYGGELGSVEGHVSPSMPTIVADGSVGNNPQIHSIEIMDGTILKASMGWRNGDNLTQIAQVNSIHWDAPVANELVLELVDINAITKESSDMSNDSNLSLGTIEGFEAKFGAPCVGTLWHPEAYYKTRYDDTDDEQTFKKQLNLITYMAKAGDAYQAKQRMLEEFQNSISDVKRGEKVGFFSSKISSRKGKEPLHNKNEFSL